MADLSNLRRLARRTYERQQLVTGVRSSLLVIPLTAAGVWETGLVAETTIAGIVLASAITALHWAGRPLGLAAQRGLHAGIVPFTMALILCRWPMANAPLLTSLLCSIAGGIAGLVAGRTSTTAAASGVSAGVGVGVATLTACLGCLGLGWTGFLAVGSGLLLGTAVTAVRARVRA